MSHRGRVTAIGTVVALLVIACWANAFGPGGVSAFGPTRPETDRSPGDGQAIHLTLDRDSAPVWTCPDGAVVTSPGLTHAKPNTGFEGDWPSPGWVVGDSVGGAYRWGTRDCHPRTGNQAIWCVGGGTSGTTVSCAAQSPKVETWAIYGPFNLSYVIGASLHLCVWGNSAPGASMASNCLMIGAGTDGAHFSYTYLNGDRRDGPEGEGYYKVVVPLNQWAGELEVYVALRYVSAVRGVAVGYMVDDLHVDTVAPTPVISPSPTATVTDTPTPRYTPSPSPTGTLVASPTPTVTRTPTATATPRGNAELRIRPPSQDLAIGEIGRADVEIVSRWPVGEINVELWWDPRVLQAVDADASVDGIQGVSGPCFWGHAVTPHVNLADNALGRFVFNATVDGGKEIPADNCILAQLNFRAVAGGRSAVYLVHETTKAFGGAPDRFAIPLDLISGEAYVRSITQTPVPLGRIRGLVYEDVDADGVHDVGEPGVGGVVINAAPPWIPGPAMHKATTDPNGNYAIDDLPANTYRVEPFEMPPHYVHAGDAAMVTVSAGGDIAVEFGLRRITPQPTLTPPPIFTLTHTPTASPTPTKTPPAGYCLDEFNEGWERGVCPIIWFPEDKSEADGGHYLWGDTDYKAHFGYRSIWPAAAGRDALDPATSTYPANMDTELRYGPIDMSDYHFAELTYWLWLDTDVGDEITFEVDPTGSGRFYKDQAYSGRHGWRQITVDFADVPAFTQALGSDEVWLRLRFVSNASGTGGGPFVDDVALYVCSPSAHAGRLEWSTIRFDQGVPLPPECRAGPRPAIRKE